VLNIMYESDYVRTLSCIWQLINMRGGMLVCTLQVEDNAFSRPYSDQCCDICEEHH
jgi:hypothetical protein